MSRPTIVWFRQDLRIDDHPALCAAIERGEPVIPVFIWSPDEESPWQPGAASRWWLHQSLIQLEHQLKKLGSRLIIRIGTAADELRQLCESTHTAAVYWSRRYEPVAVRIDAQVAKSLTRDQIEARSFAGRLLYEPEQIRTKEDNPFQVFTAFWKACIKSDEPSEPLDAPSQLDSPKSWPASVPLKQLGLEPDIPWDLGMQKEWKAGAEAAHAELARFVKSAVQQYGTSRDLPAEHGTSRMSAHLHFGEISPRTIWHAVRNAQNYLHSAAQKENAEIYLKEIGWREFAHHLLVNFPQTPEKPLREQYGQFPWKKNKKHLKAWQKGQTGYPIVDAGMRELWTTGWMHNRVRMIVSSFLVKDLLISWNDGAAWFWDTLVDADLANNTMGWQWSGGCGADAAPYFRIFNPVLQSRKFDAEGDYIRKWVPELRKLSSKSIHSPWTATIDELHRASVELGKSYPMPIVDHDQARVEALAALKSIKR